ncbi:AI-2E family transporter [Kocuria sp. M1N1S27]|uniref:AI-2E family transporter n=1 Tax=Kocuria kalidii TaxID=3376283 RepID=UPI0037A783A1
MWSARLGRTTVRTLLVILGLVLVVAAGYVLWTLRLVVVPLLIALLLAAAISPLVRWLNRRNVPKALATWISMLAAVTVLGGVLVVVVVSVSSRWNQLTASSNLGLSRLENLAAEGPLPFTVAQLRQAREAAVGYLREHLSVADAFSALSLLTTLVVGLLLVVVMLFFFLKDGRGMWGFLLEPLDADRREKAVRAGTRALETMGGYVRGITLVALIDAVGIGVVLFVLGVPLAMPLAVIVFLGAYVPIIGATLSGAFAVLVTFVTNTAQDALIVAVAVVVVQQLEGNVLQPLIMGHVLSLHPLVVLIALTAGSVLAGIAGAVLAVPLTAVAWAMLKAWQKAPETETGADPTPG